MGDGERGDPDQAATADGVPAPEGLTEEEITRFANEFPAGSEVRQLLEAAGLPPGEHPTWNVSTARGLVRGVHPAPERQAAGWPSTRPGQPARVPVATTAADLTDPEAHLDPTPARWLPLTPTSTGRLELGQLCTLWPLRTDSRRRGNGEPTRLERPDRLYPAAADAPTVLEHQQRAA